MHSTLNCVSYIAWLSRTSFEQGQPTPQVTQLFTQGHKITQLFRSISESSYNPVHSMNAASGQCTVHSVVCQALLGSLRPASSLVTQLFRSPSSSPRATRSPNFSGPSMSPVTSSTLHEWRKALCVKHCLAHKNQLQALSPTGPPNSSGPSASPGTSRTLHECRV